ncbi:hypothetical protein ACJBU6_02953 [Exserohilum turcicum]
MALLLLSQDMQHTFSSLPLPTVPFPAPKALDSRQAPSAPRSGCPGHASRPLLPAKAIPPPPPPPRPQFVSFPTTAANGITRIHAGRRLIGSGRRPDRVSGGRFRRRRRPGLVLVH